MKIIWKYKKPYGLLLQATTDEIQDIFNADFTADRNDRQ